MSFHENQRVHCKPTGKVFVVRSVVRYEEGVIYYLYGKRWGVSERDLSEAADATWKGVGRVQRAILDVLKYQLIGDERLSLNDVAVYVRSHGYGQTGTAWVERSAAPLIARGFVTCKQYPSTLALTDEGRDWCELNE